MAKIALKVNGVEYAGWESASVTRGIETVAGSFSLSVSERWDEKRSWPIFEGEECALELEGSRVITGYVDNRNVGYSASSRSFEVTGRDKTGDLVDCAAVPKKWQFNSIAYDAYIRELCAPFGVTVTVAPGIELGKPPPMFVVNPGDKVFECIERAARMGAFLAHSDGNGGLILDRTGTKRTVTSLIEGANLKSARASYSVSDRFRRYIVTGQLPGSDDFNGDQSAFIRGEAEDANIRETRVLLIRAEGIQTIDISKRRAQWEAAIRAARGSSVECEVQGWQQQDGSLWPINTLVHLKAPRIGIDDDLLISQAVFSVDDSQGVITRMSLKRPGAFTPEPVVARDPWNLTDDH